MEKFIENCGECPLRQGNYACLGLKDRKDEHGIKRQISRHEHHLRPDWCPLPVTLRAAGEGGEEVEAPVVVKIAEEGATEQEMGILHRMAAMIMEKTDLTVDGAPVAPALSALVGFEVSAYWRDILMKRITIGMPVPEPPAPAKGKGKGKGKKGRLSRFIAGETGKPQ